MAELFQSANDFSADLFANLNAANTNLVFSPFSVLSTLYLLLWGSAGTTKNEIAKTLKLNANVKIGNPDTVDPYIETFNSYKKSLKENEASFLFRDFILLNSTTKTSKAFGGKADILKIDFSKSTEAVREINELVHESTGGRIKNIVDNISPTTVLQILNTVFFKGVWEKEFTSEQIEEAPFKNTNKQPVTVDMLKSKVILGRNISFIIEKYQKQFACS